MNDRKSITAPVSLADVGEVLGKNITDVGMACIDSSVNILSKYKPVSHDGKARMDEWKGMSTGTGEGETIGDHNAYYAGADFAGIYKPYFVLNGSLLTAGGSPYKWADKPSSSFLQGIWQNSIIHRNSANVPTWKRLQDFKNYQHINLERTDVPSSIGLMSVTSSAYYTYGSNISIASQFSFALSTVISGEKATLGMCDIFGISEFPQKAYYGIMVIGENLPQRGNLTMIYISRKGIGDSNSGTDPDDTGVDYITDIPFPNGDWIATTGTKQTGTEQKFYPQENIKVVPFIARLINGKWFIMNLNYTSIRGQFSYTIPVPTSEMDMLYFTGTPSITMRVYKDTNNKHCFSIQGSYKVNFTVGTLNPSRQNGIITFANPTGLSVLPADQKTIVDQVVSANMGTTATSMGRKINATAGTTYTQTSAIIWGYVANSSPLTKLTVYSGVTAYDVSIVFYYYRAVWSNNVWSMHKFMCKATQTITVGNVTTNGMDVTFNFTQKDMGSSDPSGDPTSGYTYYFRSENLTLEWSGSRYSQKSAIIQSFKRKNGVDTPVGFNFVPSNFAGISAHTTDNNYMIGVVATLNDSMQVGAVVTEQVLVRQSESGKYFYLHIKFTRTS